MTASLINRDMIVFRLHWITRKVVFLSIFLLSHMISILLTFDCFIWRSDRYDSRSVLFKMIERRDFPKKLELCIERYLSLMMLNCEESHPCCTQTFSQLNPTLSFGQRVWPFSLYLWHWVTYLNIALSNWSRIELAQRFYATWAECKIS